MKHDYGIGGLRTLGDERILTWRHGERTLTLWDLSVDLNVPVSEHIRRFEIRTATTLDASERTRVLNLAEWEARMK